jgi:hypothetical protein
VEHGTQIDLLAAGGALTVFHCAPLSGMIVMMIEVVIMIVMPLDLLSEACITNPLCINDHDTNVPGTLWSPRANLRPSR